MDELSTEANVLIAIGVWVSFADGKVMAIETSTVAKVVGEMVSNVDEPLINGAIDSWRDKFERDFANGEAELKFHLEKLNDRARTKGKAMDLAQKVIVSDGELGSQEEVALKQIEDWF